MSKKSPGWALFIFVPGLGGQQKKSLGSSYLDSQGMKVCNLYINLCVIPVLANLSLGVTSARSSRVHSSI